MAAQKPPGGTPPRRPPTGRAGAPPSGRVPARGAGTAPPPGKNNLPIILGAAGGGLVILILLVVVLSGGSKPEKPLKKPPEVAAKEPAPKKFVPDVSAFEIDGKKKCDEGSALVSGRLNAEPGAPKDRVLADLEKGLKLLKDGLEAYDKAKQIAGKTYSLDSHRTVQKRGIAAFCTGLEKEGQRYCDDGLAVIKATQGRISDTSKLNDAERKSLHDELKKGVDLIRNGMSLFDRSYEVSGNRFETSQYQEAMKVARPIMLELK